MDSVGEGLSLFTSGFTSFEMSSWGQFKFITLQGVYDFFVMEVQYELILK